MNEYDIGKDVQDLKNRVEQLEKLLISSECNDCESFTPEIIDTPKNLLEETVDSTTFRWGHMGGKCEIFDGFTLTIYSSGRWVSDGDFKCNRGNLVKCGLKGIFKFKVPGMAGFRFEGFFSTASGFDTRPIGREGHSDKIKEHYNRNPSVTLSTICSRFI